MLNPFQKMIESQLEGVQQQMAQAADELRVTEVVGSAGGGAVKVTVSGLGEVIDVAIDPQVIAEGDCELIQDLVCAGVREALRKASELKRSRLMDALPLGGMGMDLAEIL
ncbi:MAG: YbaB/EbfC family nucleoid-associated protein [Armatimonadota bacterium]|nr:YbaB/EbfC family nucleoid-associated protein [Armatimonadota bacterium]